jgi:hypothetical protein
MKQLLLDIYKYIELGAYHHAAINVKMAEDQLDIIYMKQVASDNIKPDDKGCV